MSVKVRTTMITALLLLLLSAAVSIYTLRSQQVELYRESVKRMELALSMISDMAEPSLGLGDLLGLNDVADRAAMGQPVRVMIADARGVVLADSRHSLYNGTNDVLRRVAKARTRFVDRRGDSWVGAAPVRDYHNRIIGLVYAQFSARPMDEANAQVIRGVTIFSIILVLFGALIAYLWGVYLSRALSPLLTGIRRMTGGEFETTIPRTGTTELDEIGQAFESMTQLVGSEVRNLATLNKLATDLTAAQTLEQFSNLLQRACRSLLDANATLLAGDPRMGIVDIAGGKFSVTHDQAAFLAVNERRPLIIGAGAEFPPGTRIAGSLPIASAVVAPLITPDRTTVGALVVRFDEHEHPAPDRQDETTTMTIANLAAPILATLRRTWTQQEAAAALAEILLPEDIPQPESLEVYATSVPADVASGLGGDYYDLLPLDGDLWGVAIGDVSGKGLEAGRYTAMTKYVVRSFALEHAPVAEVVSRADAALSAQMEEMRFVTLFFCIVDVPGRTITYCCAGHLPGLVYAADSDDFSELSIGGGFVGCKTCEHWGYEEATVPIAPGDILLLYTDGVIEARRDKEEYGMERLREVIRANARRSLKNLGKSIVDDVRTFAENVLRDDLTLVLVRLREPEAVDNQPAGGE